MDNLSPILSDIFFDDVDQIFDSQCNPVMFNSEITLNHLLYADDTATLSLSQEGLQNSRNKLEAYCKEWHLVVSIKKTKIVVFNKTGKLLKGFVFKYESRHIELVREFKYLGVTVTAFGDLYNAREKVRKQANKVYFPILRVLLQKINFDKTTGLKLFDSLIKPVLTYNCELWNQISKFKLESLESNKISSELRNLF